MSLFRRALLYVTRKKGRSLSLLLLIFVLTTLVLSGFSINRAVAASAQNLRERLGGNFELKADLAKAADGQRVDDALISRIMQDKRIREYNGTDVNYMLADDLKLTPGYFAVQGDEKAQMIRLLASEKSELLHYFLTNTFQLTEGRHIQTADNNAVVVSQKLASENGLNIGSTVSVRLLPEESKQAEQRVFDLEIVGIFDEVIPQEVNTNMPESNIAANFMFIGTAQDRIMLKQKSGLDVDWYPIGVNFFVQDPQNMDAVVQDMRQLSNVDWDALKITKNDKAYQAVVQPLEKLGGWINLFIWILIIISIVLLSLVLTLWMRDRIHEIGVYLSIGIKKSKIVLQHILECVLIGLIAFCLSGVCSAVLSDSLGNYLLNQFNAQQEVQTIQQDTQLESQRDPIQVRSDQIQVSDISITVGIFELLTVIGVLFLVIILSVVLSSIAMLRMKPKQILSAMS